MLEGTPTLARQMRERILNIPSLAIDDVRVRANDSATSDDSLAHALGLVPVVAFDGAHEPNFLPADRCACAGARCPMCAVRFSLAVRGRRGFVYSHDLRSSHPQVRLEPRIPLAYLTEEGALELEAFAVMGRLETKWQVAAPPPFFTHPARVRLNPDRKLSAAQRRDLVACCPARVFELDDIEDAVRVVADEARCTGCEECVKKGLDFRDAEDDPPLVELEWDTATFRFVVEAAGQLAPAAIWNYIVQRSF